MSSILDVIENKGLDLDKTEYYAAILGETPSQGARSPLLWNAAFQQGGISAVMHPMDIQADKLESVVAALKNDPRFIGGAVTMPYKINILPFLFRPRFLKSPPPDNMIRTIRLINSKSNSLIRHFPFTPSS